uniref:Uncharacterized protein n=1 Tax=Timema monikensis TaxID=170555 RepID=A0A7R9EIX6_9NEOP|nr:unnamed protein product [Timema monikensis]
MLNARMTQVIGAVFYIPLDELEPMEVTEMLQALASPRLSEAPELDGISNVGLCPVYKERSDAVQAVTQIDPQLCVSRLGPPGRHVYKENSGVPKRVSEDNCGCTLIVLNVNFSSRTTSLDVQRNLEASVEKRTKDSYGPPVGKKLLCFIDDLNMPQVDEYGTQQPIALLKLLFEKGGMYDRGKDLNWKNIKDIGFFAAMGKAGGGRNEVDPRFISMFSVFNLTFPADETVAHIYRSILQGHTQIFSPEIQMLVPALVQATQELYKVAPPYHSLYVLCVMDVDMIPYLVLACPAWGEIDEPFEPSVMFHVDDDHPVTSYTSQRDFMIS